jgi:hypothetical protein
MRPRKYDSSSTTGRVEGIRLRVDDAGRREPCLDRSSKAGGQFGLLYGGGVRYNERRVWYMEGPDSSESAAAMELRRDCKGEVFTIS